MQRYCGVQLVKHINFRGMSCFVQPNIDAVTLFKQHGTVSCYGWSLSEGLRVSNNTGVHARYRDNVHERVRINSFVYAFQVALTRHSISSVMISRLVLNLRHPSLVSQAKRTSQPDGTDDLAYPDLIFTGHTEMMNRTRADSLTPSQGRQSRKSSDLHRGPGRPHETDCI